MGAGKLPPQATKMEEAVLGALLISKDAADRIPSLRAAHFYLDEHQAIYAAIEKLSAAGRPVDILTVSNELKKEGQLDLAGGEYKLAMLTSAVSSAANIEYHAAVIQDRFALREIIRITAEALEMAYNDEAEPGAIQAGISVQLDAITMEEGREARAVGDIVTERLKQIRDLQDSDKVVTGVPTGLRSLDYITAGWQRSDMITLAARPGEGKTAMSILFAVAAARNRLPVLFFSLEMSAVQLVDRIISSEASVPGSHLKRATMGEGDWASVLSRDYNMPIYIDDTPGLTVPQFKAKSRRLKKKLGIELIIIDYLQLMNAGERGLPREQQIGVISRGIKLIAKELGVPVIALAQLSRDVEKRNGFPRLSDLRESGSIEQDSDLVVFLHNENSEDKTIQDPIIDIVIAKHRGGSVGVTKTQFYKSIQLFKDPD